MRAACCLPVILLVVACLAEGSWYLVKSKGENYLVQTESKAQLRQFEDLII
jgi:hypothetical protein